MSADRKQSTAFSTVVGPILDADGVEYAGAGIADLSLVKAGVTAALAAPATLVIISNAYYTLALDSTNVDTLGELQVIINKPGYQMPPRLWQVVPGTTYDANVTNAAGAAGGMLYNGANTGAVIPTVTTLSNLPAITANWLTAAGIAAGALNGKGDWALAATALSTAQWTNGRAAALDNLDVAISTIQTLITNLNNLSAKTNIFGSALLEIPESGTKDYEYLVVVRDDEDKLVNLDGVPTIAITNPAGTSRIALLSTTVTNPSTGYYRFVLTVGTSDTKEGLRLEASGTISAEARKALLGLQVVDYDTATLINTILTRIGVPVVSVSGDIAAAKAAIDTKSSQTSVNDLQTGMNTLLSRITTTVATLWANLTAMIEGSGILAKFTAVALSEGSSTGLDPETQETIDETAAAVAAVQVDVDSVLLEVQKIPRAGESHRWTRIASDADAKSADVTITAV